MCGQIQCSDSVRQKPDIDYGVEYKKISHPSGAQCRYFRFLPILLIVLKVH